MSLESARKLGFYASLIQVILPIVVVIGFVAIFIAALSSAASSIGSATPVPALGISVSVIGFIVVLAALAIVGFIMFMVAMHRLSIYYSEPSIFKNVLYAFIISIISAVVLTILEFAVLISLLTGVSQTGAPTTVAPVTGFFVTYLAVIAVSIVFAIVNAVLYMRSFDKLAEKSGVSDFKTTGLLYLLGTVLTVVLVGVVLVWIAWIYSAEGFKKLKPSTATAATYSYQNPPPLSTMMQTKRCPNCGAMNSADALYCSNCGKPLQ